MSALILQTSDPHAYFPMLMVTSQTTREFCRRHGLAYESYIGIKRGYWNWHATYNRIVMLNELIEQGFRDWAIYVDADAYVVDLDFKIADYLQEKSEFAAIMIPSQATPNFWDVNAGVVLFNLLRPTARFIIQDWLRRFEKIPDEVLRQTKVPFHGENDQVILHRLLMDNKDLWPEIHLESPQLMNSGHARFIRQHLSAYTPSLPDRIDAITAAVNTVLGKQPADRGQHEQFEIAVAALYRGILGRGPDKAGLEHFVSAIQKRGLGVGLETVAKLLLGSPEYKRLLEIAKPAE